MPEVNYLALKDGACDTVQRDLRLGNYLTHDAISVL